MTIKARLKRLEDQMGHDTGEAPIDMAAIEKYQEEMKAFWSAFQVAMDDYKTGRKTPVPNSPIPPPGYEEWRQSVYGPPPTMAEFNKTLTRITTGS